MADQGRKGFGQKMEESLTPQSQKTYAEQGKELKIRNRAHLNYDLRDSLLTHTLIQKKGKEALTDGYDKLQAEITPESQKSAHQSAYDSVKGNADDQNKSMLESAKEKLGL
ncbi:hypothetical protein INT44_007414 [Umbelopsis vinacea]|uniref:Uncharacterized protein n=1 Tax=Umbelopsis vinacea TaxID=44442 RepID=A0A8H7UBG0_9FUNG|nr:hypothetical protein INT44_007414 [Umbelopsis vinacea]